jgi:hypothetical protein
MLYGVCPAGPARRHGGTSGRVKDRERMLGFAIVWLAWEQARQKRIERYLAIKWI